MKRIVNALGKLSQGQRANAIFALCAATVIALPAQTFTTLHSFDGTDGESPPPEYLIQGTHGNLYGTTSGGGLLGGGTVVNITPAGALTTLYNFANADPAGPYAGLVEGPGGVFYGTTYGGGIEGDGTVFSLTPTGMLTTLYSFHAESNFADGKYPMASLVQGAGGSFFGTTSAGGTNGEGTIFQITTGGTLMIDPRFLQPKRLLRWLYALCRTTSGCRRRALRNNLDWRRQLRWNDLQNHSGWHIDHTL